MARNKRYCWKCDGYITSSDRNPSGLCIECLGTLKTVALYFVGAFFYVIAWGLADDIVQGEKGIGLFIFRCIFGFLGPIVASVAAYIVFGIYYVFAYVGRGLFGWAKALYRLGKDLHEERQEQLQLEAVRRAELAEPKVLNGQELDALLTEEYKQKQGWD